MASRSRANKPPSYQQVLHPNQMLDLSSDDEEAGGALYMVEPDKRTCSYYFKKLDYEILRPLLIHNYVREVMHRQDDYVEMIINDGNILG
jgi:hypothetical protein